MYENGDGVPKDRNEAIKWYQKAAAQGHKDAQAALVRLNDEARSENEEARRESVARADSKALEMQRVGLCQASDLVGDLTNLGVRPETATTYV